ncbi:hypothetical protein [Actinosynnema sp. NPDC023587]|uniref:hypothetical protein n=1 Tax=Actinosynnema sp. NPDC023587 TaxID=3154695 RepID=UPI0033F82124
MTTTTYTETASAPGAWSTRLLLPETPIETVYTLLADLSASTGMPITAYVVGGDGDPADELLLVRDPSRTHGCPTVGEYESLAARLVTETGWAVVPAGTPRGILVGLGLREGYGPGSPQHSLSEVEHLLAEHGTDWTCRPARLASARLLDGQIQWYDEVGAVVEAAVEMTAAIELIAAAFRQDRVVITDYAADRTRALAAA